MKIVFTFLASYLVLIAQSQVLQKGDKLFGGSFSFSYANYNNPDGINGSFGNTSITPSYGWAVKENLVFGLQGYVSYSHTSSAANNPSNKFISSQFGFGPGMFFRKYKSLKDKFGIYFNHSVNFNYSVSRHKNINSTDFTKSTIYGGSYNFSPGVFYKFSDSFFGEANIGGLFSSYYNNGANNFNLGASFLQYFNIGINYRIPRKRDS
jgi:hypothetical protein